MITLEAHTSQQEGTQITEVDIPASQLTAQEREALTGIVRESVQAPIEDRAERLIDLLSQEIPTDSLEGTTLLDAILAASETASPADVVKSRGEGFRFQVDQDLVPVGAFKVSAPAIDKRSEQRDRSFSQHSASGPYKQWLGHSGRLSDGSVKAVRKNGN